MGRPRKLNLDPDLVASEPERLKLAKARLHDEIWRALESATTDAQKLGYSFVVLRKGVGAFDLSVRHMSWHLVVDCLKEMGALGAVGGSVKTSPKTEGSPP